MENVIDSPESSVPKYRQKPKDNISTQFKVKDQQDPKKNVQDNQKERAKEKYNEVHHLDFSGSDKSEEFDEIDIDEASNSQYYGENTAEEYDDRVSESVRLDIATCDEDDGKKTSNKDRKNQQMVRPNQKNTYKLQQKKNTKNPQI